MQEFRGTLIGFLLNKIPVVRRNKVQLNRFRTVLFGVILLISATLFALGGGKAVVISSSELKWKETGVPGVVAATVTGDMKKGPCRFFLKYPVGLVTPPHYHTADHHVTMISGHITLTVGGKDHKLGPGSYFSLTDKMPHVAKVEGDQPAVFYIEADGPWDVKL